LQHREQVLAIVEAEAEEIAAKFGSERRTVMSAEASGSMSIEDIIPNSQSLVVYSRKGYIKRIPADTFAVQHRGGKGECCHALCNGNSVQYIVCGAAAGNSSCALARWGWVHEHPKYMFHSRCLVAQLSLIS